MEGTGPRSGEYAFRARDGGAIKSVWRAFARVAENIGLNQGVDDPGQRAVFHPLRHTLAGWLALNGETIQAITDLQRLP